MHVRALFAFLDANRDRAITTDEFAEALAREHVPEVVIALLRYLFDEVLVEANVGVADGVQRALGRPPRDVATFARAAAAAGAWSPPVAA